MSIAIINNTGYLFRLPYYYIIRGEESPLLLLFYSLVVLANRACLRY